MKKILSVCILVLSSACATTNAPAPGASAYEHRIAQLEAKNALLAKKVVRLTMDKAARQSQEAPSLSDYTAPAVAVRNGGLSGVSNRLVARVDPAEDECGAQPGALVVSNETGKSAILLVDGVPTAVVYSAAVTDYIGPGVSVHICLDASQGSHELSGGVFDDMRPGTKAAKVFLIEHQLDQETVNTVHLTEADLTAK